MATNCLFLPATPTFPHSSRSSIECDPLFPHRPVAVPRQAPPPQPLRRRRARLKTRSNPQKRSQIIDAIDSLTAVGRDTVTTGESLSATWRMLWTTEKEQLFIVKYSPFFGTAARRVAGDRCGEEDSQQRNHVSLERSLLRPLRQSGCFRSESQFPVRVIIHCDTEWQATAVFTPYHIDDEIRVVKDIRKDYLIVERAPYSWNE